MPRFFALLLLSLLAACEPTPFAPSLTNTRTSTVAPSDTSTSTLTNTATQTDTPTYTATPTASHTPTLIPTETASPTATPTHTLVPRSATPSATPDALTVNVNGCDVTNNRIEVSGLPANTTAGMKVKLPGGQTFTLESASADGHGWIADAPGEVIQTLCPPTPTPAPNTDGGQKGGVSSAGTQPAEQLCWDGSVPIGGDCPPLP